MQCNPNSGVVVPQVIEHQMGVLNPDNPHILVLRPPVPARMYEAFNDVQEAFASGPARAHALLRKWSVTHLLVGPDERPPQAASMPFDDLNFFTPLYTGRGTVVYQLNTAGQESGAGKSGEIMTLRIFWVTAGTLAITAPVSIAASAQIIGGFDSRQRSFTWRITNSGDSPIVQVEIPHFHADAFFFPEGWDGNTTNLVTGDVPNEPGVCKATANGPGSAIEPGRSKLFQMHLSLADADIGRGEVKVHFANGKVETIGGVQVAVKTHRGFGPVPAIVLGAVFLLYVLWRARRGRPSPPASEKPREEAI